MSVDGVFERIPRRVLVFGCAALLLLWMTIVLLWTRSYRKTDCLSIAGYRLQTKQGLIYVSKFGYGSSDSRFLWSHSFDPRNATYASDTFAFYDLAPSVQIAGARFYLHDSWFVGVPFWLIALIDGVIVCGLVYRRYRWIQLGLGVCSNCSYNLTGNITGICPECGSVWTL